MGVTPVLIVVLVAVAWISVATRATVPALVCGVAATVLFCSTPLGSGLPRGTAYVLNGVSGAASYVAGSNEAAK